MLSLGAALLATSAGAQPKACVSLRDFQGWKAPDARTVIFKVANDKFLRLDLASACSMLTKPGVHLNTVSRGSDYICDPLDLQMTVSDFTGPRMQCRVNKITPLSDADVSALPAKYKP
jgi:hypothetical protein